MKNPSDQTNVRKVVLAGKKLMFSEKTWPTFKQGMQKDMPMPEKLATETVGIMSLLQDKANGSIPRSVLMPAAAILLLEIAKAIADAGYGEPTPQDIKAAGPMLKRLMQQQFQGSQAPEQAPEQAPAPEVAQQPPGGGIINQAQQGGM